MAYPVWHIIYGILVARIHPHAIRGGLSDVPVGPKSAQKASAGSDVSTQSVSHFYSIIGKSL